MMETETDQPEPPDRHRLEHLWHSPGKYSSIRSGACIRTVLRKVPVGVYV